MGFRQFYCRVIRVAFTHSLSSTHTVLILLSILAWAAAIALRQFIPGTGMTINLSNGQITAIALALIVAIRLLLAPYWIWQDAQTELRQLQSKYHDDGTRMKIRNKLGQFINAGNHLLVNCMSSPSGVVSKNFEVWDSEVSDYLRINMGPSYPPRFVSPTTHQYSANVPGANTAVWYASRVRLDRLHEFVGEVDGLSLRAE
jgi:hypothetical protein